MATTRDTTLEPATVDSLDNPSLDVTRWNYDPATGLLVQKLYEDGKGPSYTYTPDGKLATRTWARGVVTEYGYDVAGELASVQYSDGTPPILKTYNRLGSPVSIISAGTTNIFEYSATTLEKISDTQLGYAIRYGNDNLGRMEKISITNLYDGTYSYDVFGRFATTSFEGMDFNYTYLPGSDQVETLAYGAVEKSVSYESLRDLVTGISYHNTNGLLIAERKYAYNEIGNVISRTRQRGIDPVETDNFEHNIRSELIAASLGGTNTVSGEYGYTYDPIGNRTVTTNRSEITVYAANELNQYTNIVSDVEFNPEFDDDGNQTKIKTSTGVWFVQYNAENRPVVWTNKTGMVIEMAYDHNGRRIHKKISDENSVQSDLRFLYDGYLLIVSIETNAVTTIFWDTTERTATRPLAMKASGTVYTYTHDLTKNVMEVLDTTGDPVVVYDYDAFGTMTASAPLANRFGFSSEFYDAELGGVYYNFRHYSFYEGLWIGRDPSQEESGKNLYLYCHNNPIYRIDIRGLRIFGHDYSLGYITGEDPKGTCGGGTWTVWFTVTPKEGEDKPDGYIIQKITHTYDISPCCETNPPVQVQPWSDAGKTSPVTFWEHFEKQSGPNLLGFGMDGWHGGSYPDTKGSYSVVGVAWWHQGDVNVNELFPGSLPGYGSSVSWNDPKIGRDSNKLTRTMTAKWNCCKDDSEYKNDETVFTFK